jgi:hypothetical protein
MRIAIVVLGICATTGVARAQYNVPSSTSGESRQLLIANPDDTAPKPEESTPIGWELGASLDFITSDTSLGSRALKFTDVVLFRVHGLVAIGSKVELFGGLDLLPKQPSYTDELVWQGGLAGVRYRIDQRYSGYVRGEIGPGLDRDGSWVIGEVAAQYKRDLAEKALFWESTVGGTYTTLFPDAPVTKSFAIAELLTETGIAVRDPKGSFATWLTFGFHFPIVSRPSPDAPDPATMRALDPQTRVGVSFGMLVGVPKGPDLFIELSVLDRGDPSNPQTTLPILNGGFDQKQIIFGFNRRFGERAR